MDIIGQAEVQEAHVDRVLHDASRTSARPIISIEDERKTVH